MSEIKTDKLTGVTTAGSIAVTGEGNTVTTNLQQGLCKSFWSLDGTGTIDFRGSPHESFNVSGKTDLGTGDYKVAFANDMASANYSAIGGGGTTDTNWNAQFQNDVVMGGNIANTFTPFYDASGIGFANYANGSPQDTEIFNGMVFGELA